MARRNRSANIRQILELYGERAAEAARQALRENAETLVAEAKSRCPVKTGRLRDSIHVEAGGRDKVLVAADAKDDNGFCYAPIIEYAPWGQPFMKPAYDAKKFEMINHTKDSIRAVIGQ